MTAHMSPSKSLHPPDAKPEANAPAHDYSAGMGGLILGITVRPGTSAATVSASTVAPHKLQLVLSDNSEKIPSYKLEVTDPTAPPPSTGKKNASLLGPPIVLVRGEPAEIEVKNQSSHPTAIHWHGMELDSYYDGVAGWTGSGQQISPPINPGDSFVAHMTPPRGWYFYLSHALAR